MSWAGSMAGGEVPFPVSESEELLEDLLVEEGSPLGPAAALGCSCLSGLGGGSLTPGGALACSAGWLWALSLAPLCAWRTAFGGLDRLRT